MSVNHDTARRLQRAPVIPMRCHVLVDFDGTIAPNDPTDRLFERFADASWRTLEEEWQGGRITSRECMVRQVALLRATPAELDAEIGNVQIDPHFYRFQSHCRRHGVPITIVSDGFDRVVGAVLERAQLPARFFANRLEWQGGDRWHLALPYARGECRSEGANCKCSHRRNGPYVAIGDGRSDYCMSSRADYVIAKGVLAGLCRNGGLPHALFSDFDEATDRFAEWLDAIHPARARASLLLGDELPGRDT